MNDDIDGAGPAKAFVIRAGSWPDECQQRAFVEGAAWWQWRANGATMFPCERDDAEAEAIRRYGEPV